MSRAIAYTCPWCLNQSNNPNDAAERFCGCCGSDDDTLPRTCEHRTKSTIRELFVAGVVYIRRDPWADGSYLELRSVGGFIAPLALVHSPLEWGVVPESIKLGPQEVPLWRVPKGGWEAYTGETVEQANARLREDPDERVRRAARGDEPGGAAGGG